MICKKIKSLIFIPLGSLIYLMSQFSLEQIILPRYVLDYQWAPDSRHFVYLLREDKFKHLLLAEWPLNNKKEIISTNGSLDFKWLDNNHLVYWLDKKAKLIDLKTDRISNPNLNDQASQFFVSKNQPVLYYLSPDWLNRKQLWFWDEKSNRQKKLTNLAYSILSYSLSPDETKVLFLILEPKINQRQILIYNFSNQRYLTLNNALDEDMETNGLWSSDNRYFVFSRRANNQFIRTYWFYDLTTNKEKQIFREKYPVPIFDSPNFKWSLDNQKIYFLSSDSESKQIFEYNLKTEKVKKVTEGVFDIPDWLVEDDNHLIFVAAKDNLRERQIYRYDLNTSQLTLLSPLNGTDTDLKISPDNEWLMYIHSSPYKAPDLWVMDLKNQEISQITNSLPEVFNYTNLQPPQSLVYQNSQKQDVYGWYWLPLNFNPAKKYPVLIWLHGGPDRQVSYGWHNYWSYANFYSFFQYLLQKDFVVLAVDYHGSIGYGDKYQQALFGQVGQIDKDDVLSAGYYLKNQPYIDSTKIYLMGFSYGGYLTVKTLVEDKENIFKAGITFSGPSAWDKIINYWSHPMFLSLFNGLVKENPNTYQQAALLDKIENLKAPLLIIHGEKDSTIPYSQAKLLKNTLEKYHKTFEFYSYPEGHVPLNKETWIEAFKRIENFISR